MKRRALFSDRSMQKPDPSGIPLTPGVYVYRDARRRILYVGKARVLRRRVLSYFREEGLSAKTRAMLQRAVSVECLSTSTEKEALLLESSFIKKHRPPYNIVLRDDKQYALFRLNPKNPFPRLEVVRQARRDGARYFGPFTSALAARETWKLIHRAFHLRRCSDRAMKNRVRPCLYHFMGQCPAPCMGLADAAGYQENVRKVTELLQGRSDALLRDLREAMNQASENLEFERAAVLRDQIRAVERTVEGQAAVLPGKGDVDVVGLFPGEGGLALGMVFVRGGAVIDGKSFYWAGISLEETAELLWAFAGQYYSRHMPPPRILLPWMPADPEEDAPEPENPGSASGDAESPGQRRLLEAALSDRRGASVRLTVPRGADDRRLVDMAVTNAREQARRQEQRRGGDILEKLAGALRLPAPPRRIECVDVSHTGGRQTRVGLVVFEDGQPVKEDFRVYAMPDSDDDCATLHAWIARRLRSGPPWPDLLLVDGGRGQLSAVMRALDEAGSRDFPALAGIAKARDAKGQADRRAGNVADRIFVPGRGNPLPLREASPELLFLQNVRDHAHRFAVGRHRRARSGAAFAGELMRLPGIGPATARLLWDRFGSVEAMRAASLDDLCGLPGIGPSRAAQLKEKLGGGKS